MPQPIEFVDHKEEEMNNYDFLTMEFFDEKRKEIKYNNQWRPKCWANSRNTVNIRLLLFADS